VTPPGSPESIGKSRSRLCAAERSYLNGTFAQLCRIESPSGRERACAERIQAELRALGVETFEDGAGAQADSECGNLLVRIPGRSLERRRGVLLCAHMDTVPLQAPVEPVLVDGGWENRNEGILGADNKAAIAVLLALARHVCMAGGPPVDLELLFTVCEERSLAGARAFDASCLESELGYVFDHSTPVGEIVMSSPSHYRLEATFKGASAHAGVRPQDGRSAILAAAHAVARMALGRLDEQTSANVGTICGGGAINVVPARCSIVAEVRSAAEERAEAVVAEMVDRIHEAANLPQCECDVDVRVDRTFSGYQLVPGALPVRAAADALRGCGHEPQPVASGGASDANALIAQGLPTVNLANGTERNHEPGERVSVAALEGMLDVALELLDVLAGGERSDPRIALAGEAA
jgi:tripeptide aminopeptidase